MLLEKNEKHIVSLPWLELESSRLGQTSLLTEHQNAYKVFDNRQLSPCVILALGEHQKRLFLQSPSEFNQHPHIRLRANAQSTVIIDCEMQNAQTLAKTTGGISHNLVKHRVLLPSKSYLPDITIFTQDLCWRVLVPFSCAVLIFLEDVGGLNRAAEFITTWALKSITIPVECPPRLLVLHQSNTPLEPELLASQVKEKLKAELLKFDPLSSTINLQVDSLYRTAFQRVVLLSACAAAQIETHIDQSFEIRTNAGFTLGSEHLKFLLRQAVLQYGQGEAQPFSFHHTARLQNPTAKGRPDHLVNFVSTTRKLPVQINHAAIIASALELEAYPPGMHCTYHKPPLECSLTFMPKGICTNVNMH